MPAPPQYLMSTGVIMFTRSVYTHDVDLIKLSRDELFKSKSY